MRHLYLLFAAAFAITLLGFWPSFTGGLGPLDPMRVIHGTLATAWMAMLVLQAWLIGHGHNRWHRWIGRSSLIIAPALVISALVVVRDMLGPQSHFPRDLRLMLAWIDLWSLALFSLLYGLAIANRRRMALHARYIGCTVFVAIIPALGRLYGMNIPSIGGLNGALDPSFWTVEAVLVALILYDASKRRFLPPYAVTLAALVGIEVTMRAAPHWPAFIAVARVMGLAPAA